MPADDPYSRLQYRRLIAWPERIEREWPFLDQVLGATRPARLLDLGCGTGEHARFLAERGFEVVGVDRSPAMIEQALEAPCPAGLRFVTGDLTALESLTEGEFDGAICLGNTLPHLLSEAAVGAFLGGLRRRLKPGAPALFQLLNYERIFARQERVLPVNFRPLDGGESVFLRLLELHPDGRVLFFPTTLELSPDAAPPVTVAASKRVELHGWRRPELARLLAAAGFAERRSYGAFDGAAYRARGSRDLILVVR